MISMDLIFFILAGAAGGYFFTFITQAFIVALGIFYYYRCQSNNGFYYDMCQNNNDGNVIRLVWVATTCIGLVVGDLIYYLPLIYSNISFNISFNQLHTIKSWFLR
jgi:hypothetical protein